MNQESPKVLIVAHQTTKEQERNYLEKEIQEMKLTQNLIKQINLSGASNKLQDLQMIIRQRHLDFNTKTNKTVGIQRDLGKKIKQINLEIKGVKEPEINVSKLNLQIKELKEVTNEVEKHFRLTQAMLNAVQMLQNQLNDKLKEKETHSIL